MIPVIDEHHRVTNTDSMFVTMIRVIMTVEIVNRGIMMHGIHVIRVMVQEIDHPNENALMIMIM